MELTVDGTLAGWLDYRPAGQSTIIAHTEVLDGHEGEGLGGELVRAAIEQIVASGRSVIPTCPFAAAYIARHPELQDAVLPSLRGR
jgi:predicted GNAT family acetyltransferase